MTVEINFKEQKYITDTIIWDRDSYFIDINNYWTRLTGTIAQKVAENTTNNWGNFNQIRTQVVKLLGINPDNSLIEASSPVNFLPVNIFSSLLTSSLINFIKDKNYDELNELFRIIINKSLNESKDFIKDSIISENLETVKQVQKSTKQILITNDSKENNETFLKNSGLEKYFHQIYSNTNKEQLHDLSIGNSVFLTKNTFLQSSYLKRKFKNVLVIENIKEISLKETQGREIITINIDGASKGNPGPSSIGIVFQKDKKLIKEVSEFIGNHTNNFAEYTALIRAMEISIEYGFQNIEIKSDSELVVKQINKIYKVKDADIKDLFDKVNLLSEKLSSFKITHIPREENLRADKLANQALRTTT